MERISTPSCPSTSYKTITPTTPPSDPKDSAQLAELIGHLALSKKADQVVSIDVHELTSVTDNFLICSADTEVQVKAISDAIRKGTPTKPYRLEGYQQLKWVLLDYIDVVVHVFKTTERNYYNLEKLWADAPCSEISDEPERSPEPEAD